MQTPTIQDRKELFIAGEWVGATRYLTVVNPATEEQVASAPCATADDVERAVSAARAVADSQSWSRTSLDERIAILDRGLELLRPVLADIAEMTTVEMGMPITMSRALVMHAVPLTWDYVTELGRNLETSELRRANPDVLIMREPVGVVAAIAPWNAPFLQAVYNVLYPLIAGCPVIFKPSPETPLDALVLAEALAEAGLPAGVVSILPGDVEAGEALVRHPGVDKIAFTGSTAVGRRIAMLGAETLKRITLELGGKSAAIILDDADVEAAVPALLDGTLPNSGQVCVKTARILVAESRREELVERLSDAIEKSVVGDPMDPATQLGPLVAERQRDSVEQYIRRSVEDGARIVVGGARPEGLPRGWYVAPTLIDNVDNRSQIAQEEVFGPVVTVTTVTSDESAIAMANDSMFGLHGAVYTTDAERARAVVKSMRTGGISVNGFFNNMRAPMGGVKFSGLGRKGGREGLEEFFELKTVHNPALIQ